MHPRLIFEFTRNFPQSAIQPVFRFLGKFLANTNLYAIIALSNRISGIIPELSALHKISCIQFTTGVDHEIGFNQARILGFAATARLAAGQGVQGRG
jgi:hypothetical protein